MGSSQIRARRNFCQARSAKRDEVSEARSSCRSKNLREKCASRRISLIRSLAHVTVRLLAGLVTTAPQRDCKTRAPLMAVWLLRVSSLFCLRFCSTGGRCLLTSVRCAPVRPSRFRASRSSVPLTNRDARAGVRGGVLCLRATSRQPRRIPLPGDASGCPLFLWPGLGRAPGRLGVSSSL